MDTLSWLRELCVRPTASGAERTIGQWIAQSTAPYATAEFDRAGNLLLQPRGQVWRPGGVVVMAHLDQVTLVVRAILPSGALSFSAPAIDARVLPGAPVRVAGLPGVISSLPPHLTSLEDRERPLKVDDLVIDLGLPHDAVSRRVLVGDAVTFDVPPRELAEGFTAAGLDNRASLAAALTALEAWASARLAVPWLLVGTVEEEVSRAGATVAARELQPSIVVALDVTFGRGPGEPKDLTSVMGKGPAVGSGPNIRPKLRDWISATAAAHGIALQTEVLTGDSGTDAWLAQIAGHGAATATLSIPLRSMHSPAEWVSFPDVEATTALLTFLAAELDDAGLRRLMAWT